jgi:hypothetical protein
MIKELKINDIFFAKYEIERDILFLKVYKTIGCLSLAETENFFCSIISVIENKNFTGLAYLNI